MRVAQRRGMVKVRVAVARKLAVILYRMWSDHAEFRWDKPVLSLSNGAPALAAA